MDRGLAAAASNDADEHSEDGQLRSPYNNNDDDDDNRYVCPFLLRNVISYYFIETNNLFISFLILHRQYTPTHPHDTHNIHNTVRQIMC